MVRHLSGFDPGKGIDPLGGIQPEKILSIRGIREIRGPRFLMEAPDDELGRMAKPAAYQSEGTARLVYLRKDVFGRGCQLNQGETARLPLRVAQKSPAQPHAFRRLG